MSMVSSRPSTVLRLVCCCGRAERETIAMEISTRAFSTVEFYLGILRDSDDSLPWSGEARN